VTDIIARAKDELAYYGHITKPVAPELVAALEDARAENKRLREDELMTLPERLRLQAVEDILAAAHAAEQADTPDSEHPISGEGN
jgi:hypothetical protein